MASDSIIAFENVGVTFGEERIYDRLSFEVRRGEFVCILGPSGCGKSTLLRMIGGLLDVNVGGVTVDGRAPRDAWSEIAFVFQSPRLVPWRTALDNVLLGTELRFGAGDKERRRAQATGLLSLVGLAGDAQKYPSMLSGGERQMVAMARALMMDPKVLLLDEPSAGLSPDRQDETFVRTREINRSGVTVIMVEQNARRCLQICDRGYVLDQGRDAYEGTGRDLLNDPKVIGLYLGTLGTDAA